MHQHLALCFKRIDLDLNLRMEKSIEHEAHFNFFFHESLMAFLRMFSPQFSSIVNGI
jgi:hypothetical protein